MPQEEHDVQSLDSQARQQIPVPRAPLGTRKWWQLDIYANPDDPRGVIPKNGGHGSTINFANKQQARLWLFASLAVIGPIFIAVLVIALLHH